MSLTITQAFLFPALVVIAVSVALMLRRVWQLDPRRQWRRGSSAHEVGHALVAWFGCPTTVCVRYIGWDRRVFACYYVDKRRSRSALELWHLLALTLAGVAAEFTTFGRIENRKGCRPDLSEALGEARTLIELGLPEIESICRKVSTTVNPPNWSRISRHPHLTADETEVLNLGFRLAVTIILRHHEAFKRARALALPRFGRTTILTHDELAACFFKE
jgi:hypothetical protein